ncbi:MAG: autotransporter domain-containing protein [Xanthobacteraceae bacterium]|nr:autotransporter domain-containing protein [Xanthobacteraceae bacterium]
MIGIRRDRRVRRGWWLASSSLAAVLVGAGAPPAFAACVSVNANFDNPSATTVAGVCVTNTSFAGSITNEGTISPLGIVFTNGTISGFIASTGTLNGGISLDTHSKILAATGAAISISGNFSGNISNGGSITSTTATGIAVRGPGTFAGAISNAGTITGAGDGIRAYSSVVAFGTKSPGGGIVNSGTISSSGGFGINTFGVVSTFYGGITNTGTIITANRPGIDFSATSFFGGILNTGTISGSGAAIYVNAIHFAGGITNSGTLNVVQAYAGIDVVDGSGGAGATFVGGIANSGTINGLGLQGAGISVNGLSSFHGDITNSGTISTGSIGILVDSVSAFTGGIVNSASGRLIQSVTMVATTPTNMVTGIKLSSINTFSGGISNAGIISASANISGLSANATAYGIYITGVSKFAGGISNSGTITALAASTGAFARSTGISVDGVSLFAGGIVNAGMLISSNGYGMDVNNVTTFTEGISNSGTISSAGAPAMLVRNIATFTGGITNSGRIVGTSNGIFLFNISSFSGNISNSGTISAQNAIAIGAGVTFAAGGAIVNTGTIAGSIAAIDLTAATMPVTIDQQAGLISGAILLSSNADVLNISGGSIAGSILGHGTADTVNFALGSGTFTYGAAYSFSGINQVNVTSGTVILDGINSAANTAVSGGNLRVGDAASPGAALTGTVDVNTAGTLSGHGTVLGAVTIDGGGTLAPGGSIGTLTISRGPLTFNSGSAYAVTITPTGTNSRTDVTGAPGAVAINGGTVQVSQAFGHYNATSYTLINATGGRSGTFSGLTDTADFTGTVTLGYDANDVYLNISSGNILFATPSGANINQRNVLNGINNGIINGDLLPAGFQSLGNLSGPSLLNALIQLSGEAGAAFTQGAFQIGGSFLNMMVNPFLDGRFGPGGNFGPATGYAAEQPPALARVAAAFASAMPVKAAPDGFDRRFGVWGSVFGGGGIVNGDPTVGSHTTTARTYGVASGFDYRLTGNTTVGLALAGGGTNWGLDAGLGGGRSDVFQAGLYGSTRSGPAYLSAALSYNFHDVATSRNVSIGGFDQLTGHFQSSGVGARIEGGYRYDTPLFGLTPYAAAQVQAIWLPGYGETGGSAFALNYTAQTATQTRTELGAWFDRTIALAPGTVVTLYGRAAWAHDYGETTSASALFQALPGSNFIVNAAAPAPDRALFTAGMQYKLTDGWSLQAKFDGEFSASTNVYSGTGVLRKVW